MKPLTNYDKIICDAYPARDVISALNLFKLLMVKSNIQDREKVSMILDRCFQVEDNDI